MKIIIVLSLIALACANPVDDKKVQTPLAPVATNQNTPSKSATAPFASAPQTPSKPKRDTQQQAAPSQTAQKNVASSNVNAPKAPSTVDQSKNARPNRDTQKLTPTTAPVAKKAETAPVAPAPVPAQNSRKTRDTQKQQPTVDVPKQSQSAQTGNVQKLGSSPQVAKAPLTSTNSRTRRDAPKPVDQSKIVPSGTSSGNVKVDSAPVVKASNTPVVSSSSAVKPKRDTPNSQSSSSNNQPSIKRPTPVDQVLKQKATDAPKATDAKPIIKS